MSKKIYIGNLSTKTDEKKILDLFSQFGKVTSVESHLNNSSTNNYAYVVMSSDDETKKAIQKLNNTKLDNNPVKVIEAHPIDQIGHQFAYTRSKFNKHKQRR